MTLISIREHGIAHSCPVVSFDGGQEYPFEMADPFSEQEEGQLEWYFERHIHFPFTDQVRARHAAESITAYGEKLFNHVFANRQAYARYMEALRAGAETLVFEVAGSPDFHRFHWEAIKDPDLPQPMALQSPMIRRNLTPQPIRAHLRPSPTINLLIVTARPGGAGDVGYRTISRHLVEGLRQADLRVRVEILRPGTYEALVKHLEEVQDQQGTGYYHVIHFDVHGKLLKYDEYAEFRKEFHAVPYLYELPYGRKLIKEYEGLKAFLFMEGEEDEQADPVEAGELADLLMAHQVPIAVLNACQSGKQVGASETSLGSRLMAAGVQVVLAMGYSVTVSAAELMMRTLYEKLFAGQDLTAAIRSARLELFNRKGRRAYFNQRVDLEDWMLPVVYQNQEQQLTVREFEPEEAKEYYEQLARSYSAPRTTYGFVGRDLDVLRIERRLLSEGNVLLVRGMVKAGKTTLLHHLAAWWRTTGFVDRVFYFGYDDRAWTRQQVMDDIARKLMGEADYRRSFQPLGTAAQQVKLAGQLRAHRHLLILDNLESITGANLAIQNTLPEDEREHLRGFLAELTDGRTLVLLGSRGGEEWLAKETFESNVYELPGLDPEAASTLADRVLERHGVTKYREDADFQKLLKLLDGYPLPLEVVLANLAHQTPAQVLEALQTGDEAIDMTSQKKTESILRCIDYSHSKLSPEAQGLLLCLAPFTSVIYTGGLPQYTEKLKSQPALEKLPFDRWQEVLQEAQNWGLLSPHEMPGYMRLQPIFPYFLRSRLAGQEKAGMRDAIETAFREHYDDVGGAIAGLLISNDAAQKRMGQALARLEYENLFTALNLALSAQVSIRNSYFALTQYMDTIQDQRRGLELGEAVLARLEDYPAESLTGKLGTEFVSVMDDIAKRQLLLKDYPAAQASYEKAIDLLSQQTAMDTEFREGLRAGMLHQLGRVAQAQRQWKQAEGYYQKALRIFIEFNDRYEQAGTYGQLGRVTQEQRDWEQAEGYYQKALEIFIEFNDRRSQASTYHNLGVLTEDQRHWKQAEGYYQKALEIEIEFDDRHSQAKTYHELGVVAAAQRQWKRAEGYYQKALRIFIEFNDHHSQAGTYHQLGRVAEKQRQWEQARDYFLKALEIYVAYQDSYHLSIVLRSLGRLWRSSGDAELPDSVAEVMGITQEEAVEFLQEVVGDEGNVKSKT